MRNHFFTVSQACKNCANAFECSHKSSMEQELCKIEIMHGGYGNWEKKIDLNITQ